MKLFLSLCLFLACTHLQAQHISFCEKVEKTGDRVNASKLFRIDTQGGKLYFHVSLPEEVGHNNVVYDMFWIDSNGKEKYDNTIKQKVEPGWMKFWKEISFTRPGTFRVYVYNDFDKFLCMGELTVVTK